MIKLIYLKSALKCDSFDVAIDIKIFRVLVTIEQGRSLLQFVTTNCLTGNPILVADVTQLGKPDANGQKLSKSFLFTLREENNNLG